jgi:catechol 2,3-dioxygenase-like lactoylglutathione lyase family enzyme
MMETSPRKERLMDMKLELVPVPVSDVDRAKAFYTEKLGFTEDVDTQVKGVGRIVQLTPPGSACSIVIGLDIPTMPPGSVQALHLIVADIRAVRAELVGRGVEVGEIQHLDLDSGSWVTGVVDDPYQSFAFFSDPDGNGWTLQGVPARP